MVWLPDGGKILAVSTQYRRVTDRQTSCHGIVSAYTEHRAAKTTVYVIKFKQTYEAAKTRMKLVF